MDKFVVKWVFFMFPFSLTRVSEKVLTEHLELTLDWSSFRQGIDKMFRLA